jgi:hypothetical protein
MDADAALRVCPLYTPHNFLEAGEALAVEVPLAAAPLLEAGAAALAEAAQAAGGKLSFNLKDDSFISAFFINTLFAIFFLNCLNSS